MAREEHKSFPIVVSQAQPEPVKVNAYPVYRGFADDGYGANAGPSVSMRDMLHAVFSHKWKILALFLLSSFVSFVFVSHVPDSYESEAQIMVRADRSDVMVDPSGEGNSFLKGGRSVGGQLRAEIAIIRSAKVAEMVVDKVGVDRIVGISRSGSQDLEATPSTSADSKGVAKRAMSAVGALLDSLQRGLNLTPAQITRRERAIKTVMHSLDVSETMGGSNVLGVTYLSYSPEVAHEVLSALVDAYLQHHIEVHKPQVSSAFFEEKSEILKAQLDKKEAELEKLQKELNIASLEDQKKSLLSRISEFDAKIKEGSAQVISVRARIDFVKKSVSESNESIKISSVEKKGGLVSQPLVQRLMELKLQEVDLSTRFTSGSAQLEGIRSQIESLKQMIEREKESPTEITLGPNPIRQDLELQLETAQVDLVAQIAMNEAMGKEVGALKEQLAALTQNERPVESLKREVQLLENEYRQYINSLQVSEISAALDKDKVSNTSVVQPATFPIGSAKNQRKLLAILFFGMFMGLASGIALAFVLEYLNHSLKTNEDVEKWLGLPVLAALPLKRGHKLEINRKAA